MPGIPGIVGIMPCQARMDSATVSWYCRMASICRSVSSLNRSPACDIAPSPGPKVDVAAE